MKFHDGLCSCVKIRIKLLSKHRACGPTSGQGVRAWAGAISHGSQMPYCGIFDARTPRKAGRGDGVPWVGWGKRGLVHSYSIILPSPYHPYTPG